MIKEGRIKLHVDVTSFLLEFDDGLIRQATLAKQKSKKDVALDPEILNFPFIDYIQGSYFGDSDILFPGKKFFERDSTAVSDSNECSLYVIQKTVINRLRNNFEQQILKMDELAHKRRKRHAELIADLSGKIKRIHNDRIQDPSVARGMRSRDYFEAQLMEIEKADVSEFVHLMQEFPNADDPVNFTPATSY